MANPVKSNTLVADKSGDGMLSDRQAAIPLCVDALDGATLTGATLTTSATPTVDELEANDGVLGGKINAIIAVLEAHGLITAN
jgi:hypothetical protein